MDKLWMWVVAGAILVALFVFLLIYEILYEIPADESIVEYDDDENPIECAEASFERIPIFSYGRALISLTDKNLKVTQRRLLFKPYVLNIPLCDFKIKNNKVQVVITKKIFENQGGDIWDRVTFYTKQKQYIFRYISNENDNANKIEHLINSLGQIVTGEDVIFNEHELVFGECPYCGAPYKGYVSRVVKCDSCGQNIKL